MKLVEEKTGIEIQVKNTKRPKFGGRGRTWDSKETFINEIRTEMFFDSTWGHNFYFEVNNKWYSIPVIDNYDKINKQHHYELQSKRIMKKCPCCGRELNHTLTEISGYTKWIWECFYCSYQKED